MPNFFFKVLYQKRFLTLWWFLGITAVTLLTMSFYHTFRSTDVDQVLKGLPAPIQHIAGNVSSFKTVEGYLRQQIFALRLPLLSIILAITLLVSVTAGDEQKGLLETQLSLPVSRISLLLQKLAACILILCVAALGAVVGTLIALRLLHESFNPAHILSFTVNCVAVALVYGLIAFCTASLTGKRSVALGIGSGLAFASYLIDSMAPSVSLLSGVDKLTFFHFYQNDPVTLHNFLILMLSSVILIIISCIGFNKRDIRTN